MHDRCYSSSIVDCSPVCHFQNIQRWMDFSIPFLEQLHLWNCNLGHRCDPRQQCSAWCCISRRTFLQCDCGRTAHIARDDITEREFVKWWCMSLITICFCTCVSYEFIWYQFGLTGRGNHFFRSSQCCRCAFYEQHCTGKLLLKSYHTLHSWPYFCCGPRIAHSQYGPDFSLSRYVLCCMCAFICSDQRHFFAFYILPLDMEHFQFRNGMVTLLLWNI